MSAPSPNTNTEGAAPVAAKPSFWRSMRMVAWGFLGVRKRSGYQQDLAQVSPLHVVIAGLIALAVFIGVLLLVVRWAVASGSTGF